MNDLNQIVAAIDQQQKTITALIDVNEKHVEAIKTLTTTVASLTQGISVLNDRVQVLEGGRRPQMKA